MSLPSVADLQRKNLQEQKGESPSPVETMPDTERKKERKKDVFPGTQTDSNIDSQKERLADTLPERKASLKKEKVLMAQLSIKMPETLDRRLERYCFENDLKKQEVMAEALERILAEEGY